MADGNFEIKIRTKGKNPELWMREIEKSIYPEMQDRLLDVAEKTVERMRNIIQESIKRLGNTGTLQNSINVDLLSTTAGVHIGIGRISELPGYWEIINDGGINPPHTNRGFFAGGLGLSGEGIPPMAGGGGEEWIHTGSNANFLMIPQKPITAVGYVNTSADELHIHIDKAIREFMKSVGRSSTTGKSMFGSTYVKAWGTRVHFGQRG